MAGLSSTGFVTKRLPDIITSLQEEAQALFQDLVAPGEVVDVSTSSVLGRLISLSAPSAADLWEAGQQVYSAFDPNTATGVALDNIVSYAGIKREEARYTTADCVFTGQINTILQSGSTVTSVSGTSFKLATDITLNQEAVTSALIDITIVSPLTPYIITYTQDTVPVSATYTSSASPTKVEILNGLASLINGSHPSFAATIVDVKLLLNRVSIFSSTDITTSANTTVLKVSKFGVVVADKVGPLDQQPNTITGIATPILGWESVTNPTVAVPGTFIETDEYLRVRFRNSKFERATGNYEAIVSAVSSAQGVEFQVLYENDTHLTDVRGLLPHSFLLIVEGGLPSTIANLIWKNKPAGIYSNGNTTVSVQDTNGFTQTVRFSRPTSVNVRVRVDLTKYQDYPVDGDAQIKTKVAAYIGSLKIGEQLTYSRLYTPINGVQGHQVEGLSISIIGQPLGTANIIPTFDSIIRVTPDNITIV